MELWQDGHLKSDCFNLKIKKGNENRVESSNDMLQLLMVYLMMMITFCLLLRVCCLTDGLWIVIVCFTLYQTRATLVFIGAKIVVK